MTTKTKAQIDAEIFNDVNGGMTKVAAAAKYGTSARSIGRACQRHLASGAKKPSIKAKEKRVDEATPTKSDAQYVFLKVDNQTLKVGDKVKLCDDSRYAESPCDANPIGVEGTVTYYFGDWVNVRWDNGKLNSYEKSGSHLMKGYNHLPYFELKVGDKVHLNSRSRYAGHPLNPVDEVGEIIYITEWSTRKMVKVKFLSCENGYPLDGMSHLHLVELAGQTDESPYSYTKTDKYVLQDNRVVTVFPAPEGESLPDGTRVVLSNKCSFSTSKNGKGNNPIGVLGTINGSSCCNGNWQSVEWDNGFKNNYPFKGEDLEDRRDNLLVVISIEPKTFEPSDVFEDFAPVKDTEDTHVKSVMEALEKGDSVEYISTCSSIVLTLNGESEIVEETHPNFKAIQVAIVSGDFKEAFTLMNIRKALEEFTQGTISVKGDKVFYGTVEVKSSVTERIIDMMQRGDEGFKSLVNFFEKLMENPSRNSVDQLWGFISHNDIEIDEEGYIIGWKRVTQTPKGLFDSRTKLVPNNIGNIVQMPRWMVDADKNVTCSQGLHVGAWDYVESFSGNVILKVRVHPRDVVSVPIDYNDQKMRVCGYENLNAVDRSKNIIDIDTNEPAEVVVVGSAGELISRRPR